MGTHPLHDQAMEEVDAGEELRRRGQETAARARFTAAAELEERVADAVPVDKPRTRGVLRVSSVSLWLLARNHERAATAARRYLREPLAPGFATELATLLVAAEERAAGDEHREPWEFDGRV